jgi:HD-GYP domain-containing protein (c-di-GMP phosphodiesterase class II)
MSDRAFDPGTRGHGPALIIRLAAMIRTARIHDVTNQTFQRQLQDFRSVLLQAMERESDVTLLASSGYIYVNGTRVRADGSLLGPYHALMSELSRRAIGGVRFHQGIDVSELERFFQPFMAADHAGNPEWLADALSRANLEHVQVLAVSEVAEDAALRLQDVQRTGGRGRRSGTGDGSGGDGSGDGPGGGGALHEERQRAQQVFSRAVSGTRRIVMHALSTGRTDLRFAKRLIQPVVDTILNNEYSIVGLTALKSHDEYTYAHCVNVSTLSISMGHHMGISRQILADLGVAALIHDIGKIAVPAEVLRKPGRLTDDEWTSMRRHPIEGMKMMMGDMPGLSQLTLDSMRTCLEHHMGANLAGYPHTPDGWVQGSMSRIVAMADCYDAMTAHRAYRKRPFTSFEALRRLLGPDRDQFDPSVRWALLKTVGVYPPGSILMIDSGHLVLSMSPNPADPRRPNCKVLRRPDGTPPPDDAPEHWDPIGPDKRVLRVLSPEEAAINADEHLKTFV